MFTTAAIQKYGNDMLLCQSTCPDLFCRVQTFIRNFQQEGVASLDAVLEYLCLCERSYTLRI